MMRAKVEFKPWLERWAFVLPAIPILTHWLFWMRNRNYWFTADPAALYFLDSLSIFAGKSYAYVDHPGTPVNIIGSFLLGLTYPFFGDREAFIRYYIANPETFFIVANFFLLVANILTVAVLYRTVTTTLKQDKILAGIALSLVYFGTHPNSFKSLTYWSHNSFNFIFGTLWLLWLYNEIQAKNDLQRRKIILLGVVVGAILTTQLYLLPWLAGGVITIFVYRLRQEKPLNQAVQDSLLMLASGITGYLILLIPVYHELPRLWDWLSRLIGRNGLYGAGQPGIYSPALIIASLGFWWRNVPFVMLFLTIELAAFGLIAWRVRSRALGRIAAGDFALAIGLLSQALMLIIVLSKMYYRLLYVLALSAILPVLGLLALKLFEEINWGSTGIKRVIYAGLIASTLYFLPYEVLSQQRQATVEREFAAAYSQVVDRLAKIKGVPTEKIVTVYAFDTPSKCSGLLMAKNVTGALGREIARQCPGQYASYDLAYESELNLPYPITPIEKIDWDLVVWPGNGSSLPEYLDSVGAENIPKSWHILRGKWFYIRSAELQSKLMNSALRK